MDWDKIITLVEMTVKYGPGVLQRISAKTGMSIEDLLADRNRILEEAGDALEDLKDAGNEGD